MAGTTPEKKATTARKSTGRRASAAAKDDIVPGMPANPSAEPATPFTGFDLDALDKKTVLPETPDEDFEFLLDGHVYTMMDPRDVDWKSVLDGVQNPIVFMRLAMDDPEQSDRFLAVKLPGWKLSALFDNWQKHYNVEGLTDLNKLLGGRSLPTG
jgi:hypothetical protein